MTYQVQLDTFHGPLDLLLYLVKRDEVDIFDIPIARLAAQFLEHLNVLQLIDVEATGDFLVMAATLMEIKSRLLLPRADEVDSDAADPRLELVKQLIEYKKYKDAALLLEAQGERQMSRLTRHPVETPSAADPAQQPMRRVELWDLVSAFGRLMRETSALAPQQIVLDDTPVQAFMDQIEAQLAREGRLPFSALFTPPYTRGRLLGLFLAVLELIKNQRLGADQPDPFGDIWVHLTGASEPTNGVSSDP